MLPKEKRNLTYPERCSFASSPPFHVVEDFLTSNLVQSSSFVRLTRMRNTILRRGREVAAFDDGSSQASLVLALQVVGGVLFVTFRGLGLVQLVDVIARNNQSRVLLLATCHTVVVTVGQRWCRRRTKAFSHGLFCLKSDWQVKGFKISNDNGKARPQAFKWEEHYDYIGR